MSPTLEAVWGSKMGFPRSRGDEPRIIARTNDSSEFSPLTRG